MKLMPLSLLVPLMGWLAPTLGHAGNQKPWSDDVREVHCPHRDARQQSGRPAASTPAMACTAARRSRHGAAGGTSGHVYPVRLAGAGSDQASVPLAAAQPPFRMATRRQALSEVVVTAQKQEERLIDVPVPVTAIKVDNLIESNQVRIQDYFTTVPGLNLTTDLNGGAVVSIRGLTTGTNSGNPTTSVTIDGVPFGSSVGYGGLFALFPDIDPSDLARVEVLRGPQGTLYGSSSLGGLINYVTVLPSTAGVSGRVEADLNTVKNAPNLGNSIRAAVNLPVSQAVAVRLSGFERITPGYIDNVLTGQNGTNRVDAYGGHAALLVKPADSWSLELSALYQSNKGYGLDQADPGLGDLKQANIPGTGRYDTKVQAYSAIFKAKLGAAQLTSLTGYNVNSAHDTGDDTYYLGFAAETFGVGGVLEVDNQKINKVTQEIRLTMPLGERIEWLLGGFYTHEKAQANQQWWSADATTGVIVPDGNLLNGTWPTTYEEYAVFTNLTVHFTDRFDVQFGGREGENRQTYSEVDGGGYTTVFGFPQAPAPLVTPEVETKDNAFTYLVTPRYRFSDDAMVYARLASGYRPGGPNPTCTAFDLPCHFDPDRTQDYEIGMKGDVLDHRLTYDASLFYIDWKHIQLSVLAACGCADVLVNAGSAKSQGIELALQARPTSDLTLSGWVDYTDAVLTSGFPPDAALVGNSGDRLPFSSKVSGNLAIEEDIPISGRATAFFGGRISYVGDRIGNFASMAERQAYYPAYAQMDLHGGAAIDDWRITAFVNNVTDRRGVLGGYLPVPYFGNGYSYIQPRTIGVSVVKTF